MNEKGNLKYLNEFEANQYLSERRIPTAKSFLIADKQELQSVLEVMGYPVAMKILSPDILHRSDHGCVELNIQNFEDAQDAYDRIIDNAVNFKQDVVIDGVIVQEISKKGLEVLIGIRFDEAFGDILVLGAGGIYVELYQDIAMRLIPLNRQEIYRMLDETQICKIIRGFRGISYDLEFLVDSVEKLLVIYQNQKEISEIELNPFFLYPVGGVAVDALIKVSENFE